MGLKDIINVSKIKEENEQLKSLITPEMQNAINLQNYIAQLQQTSLSLNKNIEKMQQDLQQMNYELSQKRAALVILDEDILVQEFGLYKPRYDFANSLGYKERLVQIRNRQKECIKNNTAVSGNTNWTVNGSTAQGKKMVKDMQKLLLRAFNSECDETIGKIKYNNIDASVKKIQTSSTTISKLGSMMGISITPRYYDLKIEEAFLALEFQLKKQQEKEDAREARAQMREAAKLQRELDEQRKKIEKEQAHYQTALLSVIKQLKNASDAEREDLLKKQGELESQLQSIELSLKDIDYREANQRAGYVYIISNLGSFGENVFKIGMTRRLDPQERVDELGDASVPFKFDVHAMIFSEDAPALEAALHKAFESKKVNMVNQRREFFNVTLEEIKEVIRQNFDKTVEFIDVPDAEQYRISQKMRENISSNAK